MRKLGTFNEFQIFKCYKIKSNGRNSSYKYMICKLVEKQTELKGNSTRFKFKIFKLESNKVIINNSVLPLNGYLQSEDEIDMNKEYYIYELEEIETFKELI